MVGCGPAAVQITWKISQQKLIKSNKIKCEILYLEQNTATTICSLGDQLESNFPKKDLQPPVGEQCAFAETKATC